MYIVNSCYFYSNGSRIFSSERSENIKSRIELNPGHVPEIKDCPGKSRTDGQLISVSPCSCAAIRTVRLSCNDSGISRRCDYSALAIRHLIDTATMSPTGPQNRTRLVQHVMDD